MGFVKVGIGLALVLAMVPAVAAVEPSEASALWSTNFGEDAVETVSFNPGTVGAGAYFSATVDFVDGYAVEAVSGQYCSVYSPNHGIACFRAGLESTHDAVANSWTIDLAAQPAQGGQELRKTEGGETVGIQFFVDIRHDNGTLETREFPQGHGCDVYAPDDEYLECNAGHYFTLDVEASKPTPGFPLVILPAALWLAGRKRA